MIIEGIIGRLTRRRAAQLRRPWSSGFTASSARPNRRAASATSAAVPNPNSTGPRSPSVSKTVGPANHHFSNAEALRSPVTRVSERSNDAATRGRYGVARSEPSAPRRTTISRHLRFSPRASRRRIFAANSPCFAWGRLSLASLLAFSTARFDFRPSSRPPSRPATITPVSEPHIRTTIAVSATSADVTLSLLQVEILGKQPPE